jgi:hypothetical protein
MTERIRRKEAADSLMSLPTRGEPGLEAVANLLELFHRQSEELDGAVATPLPPDSTPGREPSSPDSTPGREPAAPQPPSVQEAGPSSLPDGEEPFNLRDDVYYPIEPVDAKKIEFSKIAKGADLLARQESCASGIARIDRMAAAVKNQGKKLTDTLKGLYFNEFKAKGTEDPAGEAKVLVDALVSAADHWCKTWSWANAEVCYFTESPEVFDNRSQGKGPVKPFYKKTITGKGCQGDVPKCQQLKCYICGGYITDPYISCAYECEHVVDAGSQVLIGRSAVAKDLYGTLDKEDGFKAAPIPKHFWGNNWNSDLWAPWFFRHYKFAGFLLPFYAFAPSHKCCNQLKSNSHFFGLSRSGQSSDGYIKGSVESLLSKVKDAIITRLDKNECKELFREKYAIDRLDGSDYTPMTHQDEIKILAPKFSLSDMSFYNPGILNEKWIGWRAIDIIENFIKPINECWKSQVEGMPFNLMLVTSAANIFRQKFKGGKKSKKNIKKTKKIKVKRLKRKTKRLKVKKRKMTKKTNRKN